MRMNRRFDLKLWMVVLGVGVSFLAAPKVWAGTFDADIDQTNGVIIRADNDNNAGDGHDPTGLTASEGVIIQVGGSTSPTNDVARFWDDQIDFLQDVKLFTGADINMVNGTINNETNLILAADSNTAQAGSEGVLLRASGVDALFATSTTTTVYGALDMTQGNVSNVADLEVEGNSTLGDANTDTATVRGRLFLNDGNSNNITLDEDGGTASGGSLVVGDSAGTTTVSIDGGASSITAGGSTNGSMLVRNSSNELTVNLLGAGSSTISDGLTVGSAGTASAVDGHLMVVDGTSARLVSDNATNSVAVNDTNTTITNTTGTNSIVVANDASTSISGNTFTYGTHVTGGMLIDGDLGVNGNIYTLNNSANAVVQVANNGLDITGASNTVGLTADSDNSAANARARLNMTPTTASLLVNTDSGVGHGISITQSSTVLSGGTSSTTLTLDDSGARFQDTTTGGPAKVTGVADATEDFDAVNYRQLRGFADTAYSGIATAHALSAIPAPAPGKRFAVGGGYGYFEDKSAFALGGSAILTDNIVVKGGWGYSNENSSANGGVSYSF